MDAADERPQRHSSEEVTHGKGHCESTAECKQGDVGVDATDRNLTTSPINWRLQRLPTADRTLVEMLRPPPPEYWVQQVGHIPCGEDIRHARLASRIHEDRDPSSSCAATAHVARTLPPLARAWHSSFASSTVDSPFIPCRLTTCANPLRRWLVNSGMKGAARGVSRLMGARQVTGRRCC